jgi:uncharacterized protein
MRVVLDTNIFISALLGGTLRLILDEWKVGKFTLIVTEDVAREYLDVVHRSKFKISAEEIAAITDYLFKRAEFITPLETITVIEADPTDNKFLEAALAGNANYLVSGDSHLLELSNFRGCAIITGREFVEWLKSIY